MYEAVKERFGNGCVVPSKLEKAVLSYIETKEGSSFLMSERKNLENRLRNIFTSGQTVDYAKNLLAYLVYYFPVNIFKIWKPLIDLSERNTLNAHIKVLEIGAGPGSSTFGLIEFYRLMATQAPHKSFGISFILIEQNKDFIDIFNYLLNAYKGELPSNLSIEIEKIYNIAVEENIDFLDNKTFDLIYASNVFNCNEAYGLSCLDALMVNIKDKLHAKGSIILIEPAENSNAFLKIRNQLVENNTYNLFSPCNSVYAETHRLCCSFSMARIHLAESRILSMLKEACIISNENPLIHNFQYAVFRQDSLRKYDIVKKKHDLLCDLVQKRIGERVNIYAIVISTNEKKKDMLGLYLCDGSVTGDEKTWLNLSASDMKLHNITGKILKGERLTLLGALVDNQNRLKVDSKTQIEVIW